MSGITSSLRFPGKLNGDLRKMGVNLVPFPRLHFFTIAQAPLFDKKGIVRARTRLNVREVTDQMWNGKNLLAKVNPEDGKYLTASLIYRGDVATQEVEDEVSKVHGKMRDEFVSWIPNNIKTSIINVPSNDHPISGTFVANTTALKGVFQRISSQFTKMFKRRAFMHWYKGEGMDHVEFEEAERNVRDLIDEYNDKQDAVVDLDDLSTQENDSEDDEELSENETEEDEDF